jgi:hypothetical protein
MLILPFYIVINIFFNPIDKKQSAKSVVAEAKRFRNTYNLKSSRIACQLLIKEKEIWHRTDIVCHTDIMEESA